MINYKRTFLLFLSPFLFTNVYAGVNTDELPNQHRAGFNKQTIETGFPAARIINDPVSEKSIQLVMPEVTTPVVLSNTDVNRLKCQSGNINDVHYSEEKGIVVSTDKDNLYIKYLITEVTQPNMTISRQYVDIRTEFYITCNGEVYTLLALPKKTPAKTILLSSGSKDDIKSNINVFQSLSLEERVIKLTHQAIKDELPESFVINKKNKSNSFTSASGIRARVNYLRRVSVEGLGMMLDEYQVAANGALSEKDFMSTLFGKNIVGITFFSNNNLSGKLYVVSVSKKQGAY